MFSPRSFPRLIAAAGFLWVITATGRAELAKSSPFSPPGGQPMAAPVNTVPLELRGVNITDEATMFSIFDPAKKSGSWVRLNEPGRDFSVKKYDADNDSVTIEHQGRTHVLAMRTSKIASSGNAVAPPPASAPIPVPAVVNQVGQKITANPTPATEAARLAEWSAEIQRRRDLRSQAANNPGTGPVPIPAMQPSSQPAQQNAPTNTPRQGPQRQRARN